MQPASAQLHLVFCFVPAPCCVGCTPAHSHIATLEKTRQNKNSRQRHMSSGATLLPRNGF